jgi:zinc protease
MPAGRALLPWLFSLMAVWPGDGIPGRAADSVDTGAPAAALPFPAQDPTFRIGKLDNGLTWYVRRNATPARRVEMRLVVAVGGRHDEPGREGTAHLVEHLLFQGTKRFPAGEVFRFLESIGSQPGADVNATTGHDNTCYFLRVPVDNRAHLEQALAILADFAHAATFPEAEVDREGAIVLAEWRQRADADQAANRRHEAALHGDTRRSLDLAGSDQTIARLDHATVRAFYDRWYTPDRMAMIVVGDVDPDTMITMVREAFEPIPARRSKDFEEKISTGSTRREISLVTDPAVSGSRLVIAARGGLPDDAMAAYCQDEADRFFQALLRARLNSRYTDMQVWTERPDDSTRVHRVEANVVPGHELDVLRGVYRELARVAQHGFDSLLVARNLEAWRIARERWPEIDAGRLSHERVDEAVRHFMRGDPLLDVNDARDATGRCLEALAPADARSWAQGFIDPGRRTVMLTVRAAAGAAGPDEGQVASLLAEFTNRSLEIIRHADNRIPLVLDPEPDGSIVREVAIPENGLTILTLSNGVDVWMKPLANGSNKVRIEAMSPRGAMAAPEKDYFSALYSSEFAWLGGAGGFAEPGWTTQLNGKAVRWAIRTKCLESVLICEVVTTDLETAFDSMHHTFLDLPLNVGSFRTLSAFANWLDRLAGSIGVGRTDPHVAYRQEFRRLLCNDHPLCGDPDLKRLGSMDINRGLEFYRSVFGNITPFTVLIAGDFDPRVVRDLAVTYIGSIPARGTRTGYPARCPFDFPKKPTQRRLTVGAKEAAQVALILPAGSGGPAQDTWARAMACRYLDRRIEDELREHLGAVYGTSVRAAGFDSRDTPPSLWIEFECAPDSVRMLEDATLDILARAPGDSIPEARITELRLGLNVDAEEMRLDIEACLATMQSALRSGLPPERIDFTGATIDGITPAVLRETLRQLIWAERAVSLVVVPEK